MREPDCWEPLAIQALLWATLNATCVPLLCLLPKSPDGRGVCNVLCTALPMQSCLTALLCAITMLRGSSYHFGTQVQVNVEEIIRFLVVTQCLPLLYLVCMQSQSQKCRDFRIPLQFWSMWAAASCFFLLHKLSGIMIKDSSHIWIEAWELRGDLKNTEFKKSKLFTKWFKREISFKNGQYKALISILYTICGL